MVQCSCGKVIEKVPDWLQVVNVEFVCNNCPNRHYKNIAHADLLGSLPAEPKPTEAKDLEQFEDEDVV